MYELTCKTMHSCMSLPMAADYLSSNKWKTVLMFGRTAIVSKVSSTVALIIESAVPDFSLFEFAKIQLVFYPCKFFLVFVCKSTIARCNLFASTNFFDSLVSMIPTQSSNRRRSESLSDSRILLFLRSRGR